MESEITVRQTTPAMLLNLAIDQKADLSKLEQLMNLQIKWEENEARKAYFEAVAEFNKNPPKVLKDLENIQFSKGNKKAMYTSLGNLVTTVSPVLGEHGLSASWDISQTEKTIRVSCRLSHRLGHSESVALESAPDTSGAKSPIQQIKSTITYLKGATFESVTGIAAINDTTLDDDGNSGIAYIDEKQLSTITDMINEKNVDVPKFLLYIGADATEHIKAKEYNKALAALRAAKGKEAAK